MIKTIYSKLLTTSLLSALIVGCNQTMIPQASFHPRANQIVRTASHSGLYQAAQTLFTQTFAKKDVNRDGLLNIQEAGLDEDAFESLDLNKDHQLTQKEMFPPSMYQEFIDGVRELAQEELDMYDKNTDTQLDYREFRAYASQHVADTQTRFNRMDRNADQHLNLEEFEDFVAGLFTGNRRRGEQFIYSLRK